MKQKNWIPIQLMPSNGKFYLTKISDLNGDRNEQKLKRENNLFFTLDGTYIYYNPTHFLF